MSLQIRVEEVNGDWPTRDHIPVVTADHEGAVYDDVDMTAYTPGAEVIQLEEVVRNVDAARRSVRRSTCKICSSPDCA